jgi:hypothetical protein
MADEGGETQDLTLMVQQLLGQMVRRPLPPPLPPLNHLFCWPQNEQAHIALSGHDRHDCLRLVGLI